MTVGTTIGPQHCLSLFGESEIVQTTAATDVITISLAASGSGDFLVGRNSAGTEKFSINSAGAPTFAGDLTLSSGLSVAVNATLTSGVSVGKDATFSSGASFAKNVTMTSGLSAATACTFSAWPIIKGGSIAIASNATSASGTATGLTTAYAVLINENVAGVGAYNAVPTADTVTVYCSASIGSAATFNWVAFKTGS